MDVCDIVYTGSRGITTSYVVWYHLYSIKETVKILSQQVTALQQKIPRYYLIDTLCTDTFVVLYFMYTFSIIDACSGQIMYRQ